MAFCARFAAWILLPAAAGCTSDFDEFSFSADGSTSTSTSTSASSASAMTSTSTGVGASGGGGGTTSTTSTSSSGGAGGAGLEDCLDGADNDGDALADCADPDCGPGHECVQAAPSGWEGYFRIRTAAYPDRMPPACPDATAPASYFHAPVEATCSACSCGAWTGAACDPAPFSCWTDTATCTGGTETDHTASLADGTCFDPPGIPGNNPKSCAMTGSPSLASPGACTPSGGALVEVAPWGAQDDVCGDVQSGGVGCGGGEACVARGAGAYAGTACIRQPGVQACPGGWHTQLVVYSAASDDRACTACECPVSGAACTSGSYDVFDFDGCGAPSVTVSGACVDVTGLLDSNTGLLRATLPQPVGGTCAAAGGAATGSVTPIGPMTFCCL